jgi:hypothetical protein
MSTSCASVIHSGRPPGASPPDLHERWRHGFVFGLIDAARSPDLDHVCRHGWATIEHRISFLNGLVGFLNSFIIYTPSTLTVVCAAPPTPSEPEAPGWPPAAPRSSSALPPPKLPR